MDPIEILMLVIVGVVCLAVGALVGILYRKNVAEAKIGTAEKKAKEVVEEATKHAETLKKEALLSAKEEIMRQKNDMEQEIKERRAEVSRTESRLSKKEENLDKKSEQLDKKNEQLDRKLKDCDAVREQIDAALEEQKLTLEKVSGYTAEQAKAELVAELEEEIRHEQAQRIVELEAQYRDEADEKACRIMALAIQRCAGDFVAESTISSMRAGWIRPSEISFSSDSLAISRLTGSKPERVIASGVSSMISSTPVRVSSFWMLRPSRPMMRPFISSLGSATEEMVDSATKSPAQR